VQDFERLTVIECPPETRAATEPAGGPVPAGAGFVRFP
jgi:hypothetical protein